MDGMRESWTDERLDDFRLEVNRRFDGMDTRFDKVDHELHRINDRLAAWTGTCRKRKPSMRLGNRTSPPESAASKRVIQFLATRWAVRQVPASMRKVRPPGSAVTARRCRGPGPHHTS